MEKFIHKKLVRDLIPNFFATSNDGYSYYTATDEEYFLLLRHKLLEEVGEFLSSNSLEELADIMEVIEALCKFLGMTPEELQKIKNEKQATRGGFNNKVILLRK